jgi:protein tyrosine phosphatase
MTKEKSQTTSSQRSSEIVSDYKDIPINDFLNFHNMMIEGNKEKIRDEYKAIQTFSEGLEKTCIASKANEKLNRYSNISPFDYNRVVLNDDEFENDYINASYINVREET